MLDVATCMCTFEFGVGLSEARWCGKTGILLTRCKVQGHDESSMDRRWSSEVGQIRMSILLPRDDWEAWGLI